MCTVVLFKNNQLYWIASKKRMKTRVHPVEYNQLDPCYHWGLILKRLKFENIFELS